MWDTCDDSIKKFLYVDDDEMGFFFHNVNDDDDNDQVADEVWVTVNRRLFRI